MLSLRSIWRGAHLRLANRGVVHTRSFGTEVPQDDALGFGELRHAVSGPMPELPGDEKKSPARTERGQYCFQRDLEDHLYSQLDFPRVMSRSDCPEVAVGEGVADVFKLRVVKGVEGFRT